MDEGSDKMISRLASKVPMGKWPSPYYDKGMTNEYTQESHGWSNSITFTLNWPIIET